MSDETYVNPEHIRDPINGVRAIWREARVARGDAPGYANDINDAARERVSALWSAVRESKKNIMNNQRFSKAEILSALFNDPATDGQWIIVDFDRSSVPIIKARWDAEDLANLELEKEVAAAHEKHAAAHLAATDTSQKALKALRVAYDAQQARGNAILLERQPSS